MPHFTVTPHIDAMAPLDPVTMRPLKTMNLYQLCIEALVDTDHVGILEPVGDENALTIVDQLRDAAVALEVSLKIDLRGRNNIRFWVEHKAAEAPGTPEQSIPSDEIRSILHLLLEMGERFQTWGGEFRKMGEQIEETVRPIREQREETDPSSW